MKRELISCRGYLSGIRSFWPAERSTEARELTEMISETSERTSEPLERRLASDQTVSPGATVTVIKEPAATGADVVPAPAFALTREGHDDSERENHKGTG